MNDKYIFLDTFVLSYLTNEKYIWKLLKFLESNNYIVLLSSLHLVELYNPHPDKNSRIHNIARFFQKAKFVIVDQQDVIDSEYNLYPRKLYNLKIRLKSHELFNNLSDINRECLVYELFKHGLPDYGVPLKEWVQSYSEIKNKWESDVELIIKDSKDKKILKDVIKFSQYLDFRLVKEIVTIYESIEKGENIHITKKQSDLITKYKHGVMRGIHLSSLVFWYDYVRSRKKIKGSDVGDIYFSILFPYCHEVIADKSRFDCLRQIKKDYQEVYGCLNIIRMDDFVLEIDNDLYN